MFQVEKDCIPLIGDSRFQEGGKTIQELKSELQKWLTRGEDVVLLEAIKKQVEDSYQKPPTISRLLELVQQQLEAYLGLLGLV